MVERIHPSGRASGPRIVLLIVLGLLAVLPWAIVDAWIWRAVL